MPKAEIVTEIAKSTGIDTASVLSVVEQFMTVVKDSLAHGENVYLRGFGSFYPGVQTSPDLHGGGCQELTWRSKTNMRRLRVNPFTLILRRADVPSVRKGENTFR